MGAGTGKLGALPLLAVGAGALAAAIRAGIALAAKCAGAGAGANAPRNAITKLAGSRRAVQVGAESEADVKAAGTGARSGSTTKRVGAAIGMVSGVATISLSCNSAVIGKSVRPCATAMCAAGGAGLGDSAGATRRPPRARMASPARMPWIMARMKLVLPLLMVGAPRCARFRQPVGHAPETSRPPAYLR